MFVPDDKHFEINEWKRLHNEHFASPVHVSKSKFAEFFGSRDLGTKLHIPAGDERVKMLRAEEKVAQKIRSQRLRNEAVASAS